MMDWWLQLQHGHNNLKQKGMDTRVHADNLVCVEGEEWPNL